MKKILAFAIAALCLAACIYPFEGGLPEDAPSCLVVSGNVLIGEETRIYLGYVFPIGTFTSTMRSEVPKGKVNVENDRGQIFSGVRKAGGLYLIDTRNAPENARYRLTVTLDDGREYATPWSGVYAAPEITDLSYVVDDNTMRLMISLDGADSLWNFRWDYTETWEYHAYFVPNVMFVPGLPRGDNENPSKIYRAPGENEDYYYCWNSRDNVEPCLASAEGRSSNSIVNERFLSMTRDDDRISVLYSILVTASGCSAAGRSYLYHQSRLSNVSGDLFQPIPSEMKGNVSNLADPDEMTIGYVEVCKRSSKRIFVNASGIYNSRFDPETLLYYPEADEDGRYNFDQIFAYDSPVWLQDDVPTTKNVKWGPKRCTDCRAWGGTKNKPEWWPNDHK